MAPPAGSEISVKIRSAIKAKLEELGAYVDEELPDYIMVMIANKKSATEMNNNLKLFLGKNAATFTKWLHEILERLQALSRTSQVPKKPEAEKKPKSPERRKDRSPVRSSRSRRSPTPPRRTETKSSSHKTSTSSRRKSVEKSPPRKADSAVKDARPPISAPIASQVHRVSRSHRSVDETASNGRQKSPRHETSTGRHEITGRQKSPSRSRSRSSSPGRRRHKKKSKREKRDSDKHEKMIPTSVLRKRITPPSPKTHKRTKSPIDKKRPSRNIVVVKPYNRQSPEDEIPAESTKPADAETRETSPSAANTTIFARAMNDMGIKTRVGGAGPSGTTTKRRSDEPQVDGSKRAREQPSVLSRIAGVRRVEMDADPDKLLPEVEEEKKSSEANVTFKITIDGLDDKLKSRLERRVAAVVEEESATVGKETKKTATIKPSTSKVSPKTKTPTTQTVTPLAPVTESNPPPVAPRTAAQPTTLRNVHIKPFTPVEQVVEEATEIPAPESPPIVVPVNPAMQQLQESLASINAMQASMPAELLPFNPQLMGFGGFPQVGPVHIALDDEDDDEAEDIDLAMHGGESGRDTDGTTFVSGVYDPDGEAFGTTPRNEATKILQRCRFFPSCTLGDQCQFIHPSQPCRTFPSCPYGQSCIYIHPPCRFDLNCKRGSQCHFSHSVKKNGAKPPSSGIIEDTSQSLDTIMASGSIHGAANVGMKPTYAQKNFAPLAVPCKFGASCANKRCPFTHANRSHAPMKQHPTMATSTQGVDANKFRWTAGSRTTQPNRFAKANKGAILKTIETETMPIAVEKKSV